MDPEEWLDDWIDEHLATHGLSELRTEMGAEAVKCRQDAAADGISATQLTEAAEGDLEAFLLREQNAITEAALLSRSQDPG